MGRYIIFHHLCLIVWCGLVSSERLRTYFYKSFCNVIATTKHPVRLFLCAALIMLLLLFLIGFGYAEKAVLIIAGDTKGPITVEQFLPSSMSSELIGEIKFHQNDDTVPFKSRVQATPINATYAILLPRNNSHSFYIDTEGKLTPGPAIDARDGPGVTSMPGDNGQMIPIYCGGKTPGKKDSRLLDLKSCKSIPSRQHDFESMRLKRTRPSMAAFGKTLIAIGGSYRRVLSWVERYDGRKWKVRRYHAPVSFQTYDSAAVKLNETALLICGSYWQQHLKNCYVYHVDKDERSSWRKAPEMKGSGIDAEMVLIDQTVYAFGGSHGGRSNIQTLDITKGIDKAQWKLWKDVKLQKHRSHFGVWVIDYTPRTTTGYIFSRIFLFLFIVLCPRCSLSSLRRGRSRSPAVAKPLLLAEDLRQISATHMHKSAKASQARSCCRCPFDCVTG